MSAPDHSGWQEYCVVEKARFRAACNDAVDASRRPVKRRVIAHLARDGSITERCEEIWRKTVGQRRHQEASEGALDAYFKALTEDPSWRTLVLEAVDRDGRFYAFFNIDDQLKTLSEKAVDRSSVKLGVTFSNCTSSDLNTTMPEITLGRGESRELKPLAWTIWVDAIESPWFRPHYALLRLSRSMSTPAASKPVPAQTSPVQPGQPAQTDPAPAATRSATAPR